MSCETPSFILLLKFNLGVELQSSERLKKCSQSSSAATLAAMLNTFYKTVFQRSFARLWAQADGTATGESMMIFFGEQSKPILGAAKRTGRAPGMIHMILGVLSVYPELGSFSPLLDLNDDFPKTL